jgi:uncharacterized protein (DUF1015 family)
MAIVKPFRGIRPPQEIVHELACLPYDVMNSEEARNMAKDKEKSLLHVTRAEIDLPPETDAHAGAVYNKSVENYQNFVKNGWLQQDSKPMYYIYAQTMEDHIQYGIVAEAAVSDYMNGVILKHELTRPDKEEDRMIHVKTNNANIEPVFFAYPDIPEINSIVSSVVDAQKPVYDFVAEDGFGHKLWLIENDEMIKQIESLFAQNAPHTYVADGHHRTAAAARVGEEMKKNNPDHTGDEAYNYFLAVHFPASQLNIIDYNRVVKDLNGKSADEFILQMEESFQVKKVGETPFKPNQLHTFGMYLEGEWYALTALEGTFDDNDPIGCLDVTILSEQVLGPLLNIEDLRTSKRIDFVGGIRGLEALEKRVDSGEMKVAFALYPVSMEQLIDIADTGNIMPPKTTWFEPKLRSGLVIHSLDKA